MPSPGDDGPVGTAVREASEEVGLDLSDHLLGQLDARRALTHSGRKLMSVTPVVFGAPAAEPEARDEVARVFWLPLEAARSGRLDARRPWRVGPLTLPAPAWHWDGELVWGLTYDMLRDLVRRIR